MVLSIIKRKLIDFMIWYEKGSLCVTYKSYMDENWNEIEREIFGQRDENQNKIKDINEDMILKIEGDAQNNKWSGLHGN